MKKSCSNCAKWEKQTMGKCSVNTENNVTMSNNVCKEWCLPKLETFFQKHQALKMKIKDNVVMVYMGFYSGEGETIAEALKDLESKV